jgi:signal transduction histidine kinase
VSEIQLTTSLHRIKVLTEGEPRRVPLDVKLMRQAVTNLLSNAVKYSPHGGIVKLHLVYEDQCVLIRVQDEGMGIPETDQKRLFDAFYRAGNVGNISGTGLGLPIVKRAVEAHKGTITVESKVGMGTTFTIGIPG